MEVCVEAPEHQALPEDTFLSLRIADGQKQVRFTASRTYRFPVKDAPRTYRFPDAGGFQDFYSRIEVYKRIGIATVPFDQQPGKIKEVVVTCSEPGFPRLQLGILAKPEVTPVKADEKAKRLSERVDQAQAYLSRHKIPELIAEAMRRIMHDKPDDPHAALSAYILSQGLSPPPAADQQPQGAPPPPPTAPKPQRPPGEVEERDHESYGKHKSLPPPPPPPSMPKPDKPPGQVEERDHESYGKQESAPPPPAPPTMPKPDKPPGQVEECELESYGKDCSKSPAPPAEEALPASFGKSLLGIAPHRQLPSVATWMAPPPEEPAPPTGPAICFTRMPSVGTWLSPPMEVDEHEARQEQFMRQAGSSISHVRLTAIEHLEAERNSVLLSIAAAREAGDLAAVQELEQKVVILMISLQAVRNEHESHR